MTQLPEKLLPHSAEAEVGVLGSLLIDPEAYAGVRDIVQVEDFYREAHRMLYRAIGDINAAGGTADLITLCDELERQGKLDDLGGVSVVGALANQVPTSRNIGQYARIVEECAVLRRLIDAAGQIAGIAYARPDAGVAIQQAQQIIAAATARRGGFDSVPAEIVLDEWWELQLDAVEQGTFNGMRTGIPALDRHLQGIGNGELAYLLGRPGSGKSLLAAEIAKNGAAACRVMGSGCVEWLTFEMVRTAQVKRLVTAQAGLDGRIVRAGFRREDGTLDREAIEIARQAKEELKAVLGHWLRILDKPLPISEVEQFVTRAVTQRGCRLLIVDYLGLIRDDDDSAQSFQRVSNLSNRMQQLTMALNIPVLCLVQMSRKAEERHNKRPKLDDGRESGHLEQDGHIVLGTYAPKKHFPNLAAQDHHFGQLIELSVLKARDGDENTRFPIHAHWPSGRISEWPADWDYKGYFEMAGSEVGE